MADSRSAVLYTALAGVRFFGPAILILIVLSLLWTTKRTKEEDNAKSNGYAPISSSSYSNENNNPIVNVTVPVKTPRRPWILTILVLSAATYLLDGTVIVLQAVLWKKWEGAYGKWMGLEATNVLGLVAFGGLVVIGTWKDAKGEDVWLLRRLNAFALVAVTFAIAEVVLLGFAIPINKGPDMPPHIPENPPPPGLALAPFVHFGLTTFRLLVLLPFFLIVSRPATKYVPYANRPTEAAEGGESMTETSNLLTVPGAGYGTLPPPSTAPSIHSSNPGSTEGEFSTSKPAKASKDDSKDAPEPSWGETLAKVTRLIPYLWPAKSPRLQFLASLCFVILLVGRVINVLMPLTLRSLVQEFEEGTRGRFPLELILAYCGLRLLQGSGGLGAARDILWAPVMQYSDRGTTGVEDVADFQSKSADISPSWSFTEMSQLCFDHLLNLSLAFHTHRKTGEIMRILDRGSAINRMFELLLFSILPTLLDIIVAVGAFFYFFGWELCLVICIVMVSYIGASISLTRWRTKLRRAMVERDVITRGIHTDSLLNYETIKYFVGEEHEGQRYREAMAKYQVLEYKVIASLNLLNFIQNFIISVGLLVGSLIVASRIVNLTSTASDFVFFITYLAQLYGPLNMLGSLYRAINQSMVDTEKLLTLLNEPTEVNDKPGAPDLVVTDGAITFENVSFSYDKKTTALHDVSFTVPKGHSVALVGESGGGKSTILRLLFRQYDLQQGEGRILIDGQDIRDVTQSSLRKAIGVVPQDSVLFNASIVYNIGYGKFGSSQEEIENAAQAAQMHDRILTFPDGYETRVGERGVRLSGGEKQRVSIARTFLKNPPILALDEATSALDTATEKEIQKALQNLLSGRTSLSIAHRLSTISSADIILVLKDGRVVESGSHEDLLARKGEFSAMWAKQVTKDDAQASLIPMPGALSGGADEGYIVADVKETMEEPAPAPQVTPEVDINPFLAPGPVIVALPPTEAELKAEQDLPVQEENRLQVESAAPSKAPSKAPSVRSAVAQNAEVAGVIAAAEASRASESTVVGETNFTSELIAESPSAYAEDIPEEAPTLTATEATQQPAAEVPAAVAFPTSTPQLSPAFIPPVSFPASPSESSSQRKLPSAAPTPSISFMPLDPPSARQNGNGTQTPAEDKEPKRKRISSQNLQRLARRLSLGRKNSTSNSIPQVTSQASNGGEASREASIDIGPSTPPATSSATPIPKTTSPAVSAAVAAAASADAQSPSESESISTSTSKLKKKQLQKKKPTKKGTTF
ncbi:hypothetical protein FRB98_006235 [Tulasnella sp. 332]|nr:hypothetical protein FRB98_006235 [Tulasnella sp. 332]